MDDTTFPVEIKRRAKVVAAIDSEGVPRGTRGQIMYVAGFTWKRARVRFANGVERGGLDARHLMSVAAWEDLERQQAVADAKAEQQRLADELRSKLVTGGTH